MFTLAANTYTDAGSGNAIVFLHGFCESKEIWSSFTVPLQEKFRIIALDLPGFGSNTEQPVEDFSMEAMADYVYKAVHQLEVKKCIVVGHSLGGYVALALAERHPHLLKGLCLFHSTAFADTKEKKENRSKTIDFVKKHGVETFIRSFVPPLFAFGLRKKLARQIEELMEVGIKTPEETVIGATRAMRDRKKRLKVLEEAKYPVLFIAGKDDQAVTLDKTLEQCHLPANSLTCFLADCGHMGMYEKPYETRKAIEKFAEIIFG